MDYTAPLMILTIKICTFGYNRADGLALAAGEVCGRHATPRHATPRHATPRQATPSHAGTHGPCPLASQKLSELEKVHAQRASRALPQLPSLLEFFSFVYFYGGVLAGPPFEMRPYLDFVERKQFAGNAPPASGGAALWCIARALACYPMVSRQTDSARRRASSRSAWGAPRSWSLARCRCSATSRPTPSSTTPPSGTGCFTRTWP
jgi:hypothetical protein